MKCNFFLLLAFLLNSSFIAWAQKPDIKFKHITPLDGLSHSFVRKVVQDHVGFIWIATANGLNKYDGNKINIYKNDPLNQGSLTTNDITFLHEDKNKNLWIASISGVHLYNRTLDIFTFFPETVGYYMNYIYEDSNNNIWLAAKNASFKYNQQKGKFEKVLGDFPNISFTYFVEDQDKNFWIGTNEGIFILDKLNYSLRKQEQFKIKTITAILKDKKEQLWFSSREKGIMKYNTRTKETTYYFHDPKNPSTLGTNNILSLQEDSLSRIWMGSENSGLFIFDQNNNSFYSFTNNEADFESLIFNTIYSIYSDKHNNIWLATYGGVDMVKKSKFAHIRRNVLDTKSLNNNNIICFWEDRDKNIWIGTDGGGLNLWNRKNGTFKHYKNDPDNPKSISANAVTGITEDNKGRLWITTWGGGLNLFLKEKEEFVHFKLNVEHPEGILNNDLFGCYYDKRGNIWIYSVIGLDCLNPETLVFTHHNIPNTGLTDLVSGVLDDKEGSLWIGAFRGLHVLDRDTKKVTPLLYNPNDSNSISNDLVFSIYEDSKDNIWVSTGGGLNLYNKKTKHFKAYRQKEGLPTDGINGVLEDKKGMLWVSTSNGISMFNPTTEVFKNYNIGDGLQGREFKIKAFYKLQSGEMLFGGNNGFNILNPEEVKDNNFIPPVMITNFSIFNENVDKYSENSPLKRHINETEEIILSNDQSVFSIDFVALNYISPEKNQYAYILEGFENKWNYVGNKSSATYTNLDPGIYTFKVIASNNDGVWNEEGTSIKIIVKPPYWATWWFRSIIFVVIVGGVFSWYAARIKRMNDQKAFLEDEVKKRTFELATQAEQLKNVNLELNSKSQHIEELYLELKDSIRAAQGIQNSILPSSPFIKKYLPESFILNKPKDVVGGDFYWFNVIDEKIIIAAVDCTGHGVSGAFMSIMGHHFLNHCVALQKNLNSAEILERLNEEVSKELNQFSEDEKVLEGMDIGLCIIDKKKRTLHFAGASTPLYIVRDGKIIDIKGNRYPIGLSLTGEQIKFTNHEIDILEGDTFYVSSDGYPDQFGGESGTEKFKYQNFRNLLLKISEEDMEDQSPLLEKNLSEWRKQISQIDDILVIGFKVPSEGN